MTETDKITEDVETSDESQRTDDTVSEETVEETKSSRVIRYKADGQLYEEEIPDPDSDEYESYMQDKLAGWRGKRKEKGKNDPGVIEEAIERGVAAGLEHGKPKQPTIDEDPFQLMSERQRKEHTRLKEEGTADEWNDFFVELALENRKASFLTSNENQHLKKVLQLQGAAQEMRMIAKIDADFPDPEVDPDAAWNELNKQDGYFNWMDDTGVKGSTNRTYKLYLKDIGKEAGVRMKKATGVAKPAPKPSSDEAMENVTNTMGSVSGGGAAIGREADETEIKRYINQHGIRAATEEFGQDNALKAFNKNR